jgi:hypothetical protein
MIDFERVLTDRSKLVSMFRKSILIDFGSTWAWCITQIRGWRKWVTDALDYGDDAASKRSKKLSP